MSDQVNYKVFHRCLVLSIKFEGTRFGSMVQTSLRLKNVNKNKAVEGVVGSIIKYNQTTAKEWV